MRFDRLTCVTLISERDQMWVRARQVVISAEHFPDQRITLRVALDRVGHGEQGKGFDDVVIAQPNATSRSRFADRAWLVRTVNAIAL